MALPTLIKTWRFRVNDTIAAGASNTLTTASTLIAMLNALLGGGTWTDSAGTPAAVVNPWTVVSSNGRLTGPSTGTNLLNSTGELAQSNTGNQWWIVVQNVDGCQLLIRSPQNTNAHQIGILWSASAGFTGGTATTFPTATDQILWATAGNFLHTANTNMILHVLHSTDGRETRVMVCQGGFCVATIHVGRIRSPQAGISLPSYFGAIGIGSTTLANYALTSAGGLLAGSTANLWLRHGAVSARLSYSVEMAGSGELYGNLGVVNEFNANSEWPFLPLGIGGFATTGGRGRAGQTSDIWLGAHASPVATGDQYPAAGTIRQFSSIGHFIQPWNRSVIVVS